MAAPVPLISDVPVWMPLTSEQELSLTPQAQRRYGPSFPGAGVSRVADPDDADLFCCESSANTGTANGIGIDFENEPYNQYQSELVWGVEIRCTHNSNFQSGGGGQAEMARMRVADSGGTVRSATVRHASTAGSYRGQVTFAAEIVHSITTQAWASNNRLEQDEWSVLLVRYVAADGVNPGTIDVWIAKGKRWSEVDPATDLVQVITGLEHQGRLMRALQLVSTNNNGSSPLTTQRKRLCALGRWQGSLSATFENLKPRVLGTQVGVDTRSATAGKRDVRLRHWHDRSTLGAGAGVEVGFEVATDEAFTNVVTAVAAQAVGAPSWAAHATATGLDESTEYFARAQVTVDAGGPNERTFASEPVRFRTLSRATPRTIRVLAGGCHASPSSDPNVSYQRMLEVARAVDIDEIWSNGDIGGYTDNRMRTQGQRGLPSTANVARDYHVNLTSWDRLRLAREAREKLAFDDHELVQVVSNITAIDTGVGSVLVTTATDHRLRVGSIVKFRDTNSTPALSGNYEVASAPTSTTFTVNATVTGAGSAGTVELPGVGWAGLGDAGLDPDQYTEWLAAWKAVAEHCRPAVGSPDRPAPPDTDSPAGVAAVDDDVWYYATDTAGVRWIHIDCRIWRDYGAGTMMHPEVFAWLLDQIATCTLPGICIDSSVRVTQFNVNKGIAWTDRTGASRSYNDNWGRSATNNVFGDQRDEMVQAVLDNANVRLCAFVTHDDHFQDMTRGHGLKGEGIDSGRPSKLLLAISSSCLSVDSHDLEDLRDPTDPNYNGSPGATGTVGAWDEGDEYEFLWNKDRFAASNQTLRGFVRMDWDESGTAVRVIFYDGETGDDLFDETYAAPPASGVGDGGAPQQMLAMGEIA